MHILIVDDDDDIREVLGLVLRSDGHWVDEAVDGVDALARLQTSSLPSLILLDLMMPRLDGEGFVNAMRKDARLRDIPVCILSGDDAARKKAEELGSIECLVKPIELRQLTAIIRDVETATAARNEEPARLEERPGAVRAPGAKTQR